MDDRELTKAFIRYLNSLQHITSDEIPDIDLYMDQVLTFMDTHLSETRRYESDKVLTKTMINNYAKNRILPAPVAKKYKKDHMIYLIFIYYLKNILSISDIQTMFSLIRSLYPEGSSEISMPDAYDRIVESMKGEMFRTVKDISHKLFESNKLFSDLKDPVEKDRLATFTYLCMLGFDVYLKKQLMERIIDNIRTEEADAEKERKEKNPRK